MSARLCGETQALPLSWGGEVCVCIKDYRHVFAPAEPGDPNGNYHECSCGSWFYDDQQIAEANAKREKKANDGR